MGLKTDYKDDVFTGNRKWDIGTVESNAEITDVTVYSQNGDPFSATDINDTNIQVNTNELDIKRRSLIINGDFLVDQRGNYTAYTVTNDYVWDRWKVYTTGTLTSQLVANTATEFNSKYVAKLITSNTTVEFRQSILNPNNILYGKTSTISFWVKGSIATTASVALRNQTVGGAPLQTVSYNITTSWVKQEITFNAFTSWSADDVIQLFVVSGLGSAGTFEFALVQFVLGQIAPDFDRKPYADVLAECKYYGEELNQEHNADAIIGYVMAVASTYAYGIIKIAPKRVLPTLIISATSNFRLSNGIAPITLTGLSFLSSSCYAGTKYPILANVAGGLTAGRTYLLTVANVNARAFLDSEL